ncbi:acyltransferase family protein [Agromyces aerolatus]|uniref:acyltransferase family protein n=1 Tax=Agromyces sp. LY-1074 TaxID=3074080 RepID=UPI0028654526|nr:MULTISPECIES: acyltransferase [unclassified Agromyces]MDR5698405.1 acyltransferase [Agromyces sp. LY-1074]MDR5704699.1 acyltransferase [Agromyces sp. LY-1358]
MGPANSERTRTAVRPEIQALRAVAVGAVVLHHGWPAVAPAGYMGVDVFFVVSGFLITGLLLRDAARTGRMHLGDFYLRRARRILPAAIVVLATVTVATLALVPQRMWGSWFREFIASALYYQNWLLLGDSQNPARDDLRSSPVQHFWSLSVEEQFYLAWPLLLILGLWIATRWRADRVIALAVVLGSVTAASFVYSLIATAADHNVAYFSTLTRAWEFGVGGLLALLAGSPLPGRARLRSAVSWIGLVLIFVPIVTFRTPDAFPGLVVGLPVLGTLAVIWAGMPQASWSPARIAGLRPVQWLGDVSYSLYLWHWPIFMFVPYLTGMPSPAWLMAILVAVAITVAGLSKRYIEDPFRRSGVLLRARHARVARMPRLWQTR